MDRTGAERLAKDMAAELALAENKGAFVTEVEHFRRLIDRFPRATGKNRYKYQWTAAVFVYFRHLALNPTRLGFPAATWKMYPEEKPYKGEFLTDFAIWEEGYGLRIVCESQWYEGNNETNRARVASALDKLLHVRADIKVLVFEDSHETGTLMEHLRMTRMNKYLRFSDPEYYVLMQWHGDKVRSYLWCPTDENPPQLLSA